MADSRELTFGLDFGLKDAIDQLEDIVTRLEQAVDSARDAEEAGRGMGAGIQAGADTGAAGLRNMRDEAEDTGDSLDNIGTNFRAMGREADSFGSAVDKSMGTAAKESNSVSKTLRAGFDGAIGYTEKKFSTFTGKVQKGVKSIGTAFTHPIATIKGKFLGAVEEAANRLNGLGDDADDARRDLDDMGDEGEKAGGEVKEAIKGALAAFVGFEAIQAGIDMLKELGAAAIEAAGAAENSGKKFEASFAGTDAAAWVDNYAASVHRSTAEVQSFMVSNKAMYGEMGITGDAASELSKITTSLAYDFGNAFSMADADALGVVQDYLSGNSAALEEYGIHIDDTVLKNKAMEMGLGSQIDELDDAAMAQVRLNALLDKSGDIQQAAIKDTGGLVNSTKSLNGVWSEFMADAGSQFTPVLEGLFGTILESWPTIEPMLMDFVSMLSEGLGEAIPVVMELGQTLLPVLTDVLGTLFQAATPLISVFSNLAQTILPPLANIVGMIAETVMPPLVDILNTLTTSIIEPLMGPLQSIAEALLPPIAQLLGLVSPILEAMSPVLSTIGDVLGAIADVLGTVVGWLADGVGKVVNFFSGLFGGASESEAAVNDLSGAVENLDGVTSKETSLAVDTSEYQEKVNGAAETATKAVEESSNAAAEITDVNFMAMGTSAEVAYGQMQTDAETAWDAMTAAADAGATSIVDDFKRITAAAREANTATSGTVGTNIPHNASGTDNFPGGPTWMNEEGGELAILPGGSAIIPADQTERLVNSFSTTNQQNNTRTMSFNPQISIVVNGGADGGAVDELEARIRALFGQLYAEAQEKDYAERAMQHGFA